jgi:hypothetical protein
MGLQEFRTTDYEPRKATVPTPLKKYPSLAPFFKSKEPQEFEIRALTGEEIYTAEHRVQINKDLPGVIEAIMQRFAAQKINTILDSMGLGESVPDQKVYEQTVIQFGIEKIGGVDVQLTQEDAVKFLDNCTAAGRLLFKKILTLSNMGNIPLGESNASGTTQGSETP